MDINMFSYVYQLFRLVIGIGQYKLNSEQTHSIIKFVDMTFEILLV